MPPTPRPEQLTAAWSDVELELQRRIRRCHARIWQLQVAGQPILPWRKAEVDRLWDLLTAARKRRLELCDVH